MVFIQYLTGVGDIEVVLRFLLPRQADHPVEIGLDDAVLGGLRRHFAHPVQLAASFLVGLLGHSGLGDAIFQFLDLGFLLVALAQFLLDGLHLFAQVELALHLLHLTDGLGLDLTAQFQNLQFLGQQRAQFAQLLGHAVDFQQLLRDLDLQPQTGRDEVDQLASVLNVQRRHLQFLGQVWHQVDELAKLLLRVAHQRLCLDSILDQIGVFEDVGTQIRIDLRVLLGTDTLQSLHDQPDGAIRRAQHAMHDRHGAGAIDLVRARFIFLGVFAGKQPDDARLGIDQRFVYQANRALLANGQRQPHHRVDHHAAQRQDRQA